MKKGISKFLTLILTGALAFGVIGSDCTKMRQVEAEGTTITIDETNFPDEVFREYIKSNADSDGNGRLTAAERDKVKTINVNGMGIGDLKGIEHFTKLKYLYAQENDIKSINVASNVELLHLYVDDNPLTGLDVRANVNLTNLGCGGIGLKSVNVTKNKKLLFLSADRNKFTKLNLSNNTELEGLYVAENQLSEVDLSNNAKITDIIFDGNAFTTLDMSATPLLESLSCNNNQLTSLNLSQNKALNELLCSNNALASLDVSELVSLEILDCSVNKLTSLNVKQNKYLKKLYLGSNLIKSINLSLNKELVELDIHENKLQSLDTTENWKMETLNCEQNSISTLSLGGRYYLKKLVCTSNKLTTLDVTSLESLRNLNCSNNLLTELDVTSNKELRYLYFDNNDLTTINLDSNDNLIAVTCCENRMSELNLTHNTIYSRADNKNFRVRAGSQKDNGKLSLFVLNEYSRIAKEKFEEKYNVGVSIYAVVPVAIKSQPRSAGVKSGEKVTISVEAEGDGLTYQWYERKRESGYYNECELPGSNTSTLTFVANEREGLAYFCRVYDRYGFRVTSNIASLSIYPNITQQPMDRAGKNSVVKFTIAAKGENLTYQWQWRKTVRSTWSNCGFVGCTTPSMLVESIEARNGYQYRCVVKNLGKETAYSEPATLYYADPVKITGNPKDLVMSSGTAKFTAAAVGDGLTYQWQWRRNASSNWAGVNFTGCETPTLSVPVIEARNGFQYRVKVTDQYGYVVYSEYATLHVSKTLKIVKQPKFVTAKSGTAVFDVLATGEGLKYQWQWRRGSSYAWGNTDFEGCHTNTLKVPVIKARASFQYRCVITDKNGNKVYSNYASLYYDNDLKITKNPQNVIASEGKTVQFTVEASGSKLTYQWEWRKDSDSQWGPSDFVGCKTATLNVEAIRQRTGYEYRCKVTDLYGRVVYTTPAQLIFR